MSKEYKWRAGAHVGGAPVEVVLAETERLGIVNGDSYVEAARPEGSPLHPTLNWNDHELAEQARRHAASTILRAIIKVDRRNNIEFPYYTFIPSSVGDGHYLPTEVVVRTPDLEIIALGHLRGEIASAVRSLQEFESAAIAAGAKSEKRRRITAVADALGKAKVAAEQLATA